MMVWWAFFFSAGLFYPLTNISASAAALAAALLHAAGARAPGRPLTSKARCGILASRAVLTAVTGLIVMSSSSAVTGSRGARAPRRAPLRSLRCRIERTIDRAPLTEESNSLLHALLLADRSRLGSRTRDDWRRLGISHFLALSGLHAGLIALPLSRLLGALGIRGAAGSMAVVAVLSGYAAMTGCPVSLLRALALMTIFALHRGLRRRTSLEAALAEAVFFILLLLPGTAFETGFQLSVAAVAGIALLGLPSARAIESILPRGSSVRLLALPARLIAISTSAWLLTMPLCIREFGFSPVAGPLASLAAAPLVCAIMYSGAATVLVPAAAHPLSTVINAATAALCGLPVLFGPLLGAGVPAVSFNPVLYASSMVAAVISARSSGSRLRSVSAAVLLLVLGTGGAGTLNAPEDGRVSGLPKGLRMPGGERLLVVEGPLGVHRARRAAAALVRSGRGKVEVTVVEDCSGRTAEGLKALCRAVRIDTVLCCPFIPAMTAGPSGMLVEGTVLRPVNRPERLSDGSRWWMVAPRGKRNECAPLEESALRIYPLDLHPDGG